ncbi:YihY/virulence factor BrkB family protein [Mesobacterium pallidum]|uniref:YihY/virulence factor BrkB family protein n=1 Tax=Mesobacterium pallidum TaxID=2872037 RepID=UPI001EE32454|nr:YihY/virulence factor BrkB family protein [Mesobacterium pallidum]
MKAIYARIIAFPPVRELLALLDLIDRANLGLIAAGIGFFATLAVFPALAVLVLTWSIFFDPEQIQTTLELSQEVVPPEVFKVIADTLGRLITAGSYETLTYATIVSFLFALWSARAGVSALIRGLNAAHSLPHRANTFMRYLQAILLTLSICGTAVVAIAAIIVVPIFQAFLPQGAVSSWLVEALRWGAALGSIIMALGLTYRLGPNFGDRERPGWISPGAILAAVLWLGVSLLFSIYLQNFANYNEVYGSLGAAVALLMWFYLSAYVVLIGGALNARIFRRHRDEARAARAARHQARMSRA